MKSFVSRDKFVWECKSWHKATFFQPKNGAKWAREENPLHGSKCNESFMEGLILVHPFHCPLCFLLDDIDVLNCIEEKSLLILVLDVSVNQERVSFWMDVFHGNLEAIKAPGFRDLNFWAELLCEIFHNNSITGGKECQDILNEMLLVGVEFLPVSEVLNKIDFISSPERSQMFFVHVIDWRVVNGEENKSLVVIFKDWFWGVGSNE